MQNNYHNHHHRQQQQQHIIEIIDEEEDGQGMPVHESNRPLPPPLVMPPGSTNRMHAGVPMGVARRTSNPHIGTRNHADAGNANPAGGAGAGPTITYERVPHGGQLPYGYGARSASAMNSSHNHMNAQVVLQKAATRTASVWKNQLNKFHTAGVPGIGGRPSGQAVKKEGQYTKAVFTPSGKKKATSSSQTVKNKLPGKEKNVVKKKRGTFATPPTIPTINVKRKAIIDTNLPPPAQKRKRDSTSETTKKNEDKEGDINQVTNPITAKDVANIDLGNQEEAIAMTNLFVRQLMDNYINASNTPRNNNISKNFLKESNANANKNFQNNKTNKKFVKDSNESVKDSNNRAYFVSNLLSFTILNGEEASKIIMDVARMYVDSDSINGDVLISEQTVSKVEIDAKDYPW